MTKYKRQSMLLPPRWLNCPNIGDVVNDLFVPFKTPLDEKYDLEMQNPNNFLLNTFLSSDESENIGMIINLTKTDKYYDPKQIEAVNKDFEKIPCEGYEGPPSQGQVQQFIDICSSYFDENDSYIGVHCTHGFNRTGFMIVSYLCDKYEVELDQAVNIFAVARPPGIYKQEYLDELAVRNNYKGSLIAPNRPSWCEDESEVKTKRKKLSHNTDTFSLSENDDSPNDGKRKQKGKFPFNQPKIPNFMEGVKNVSVVTDETVIEDVQEEVRNLMNIARQGFLGSQPVSLTKENLNLIATSPYMVSWKADGTRYMMLIAGKDLVYMFDRDNCVYKVDNINFPKNLKEPYINTLVDGEMVIDIYEGKSFPRFLIYDIISLEGKYVGDKTFLERFSLIKTQIIDRRNKYVTKELKEKESFGVRIKDFWPIEKAKGIWEGKFRTQLCHEMDGLIFQPCGPDDKYVTGRCIKILKWKPANLNSIDFKLNCRYIKDKDNIPGYYGFLYVSGEKNHFGQIDNIKKDLRDKYDNKIVECTLNPKSLKWEILRERTDKSIPNHISTAKSVFQSIQDPVHIEHVYDAIKYKMNH